MVAHGLAAYIVKSSSLDRVPGCRLARYMYFLWARCALAVRLCSGCAHATTRTRNAEDEIDGLYRVGVEHTRRAASSSAVA